MDGTKNNSRDSNNINNEIKPEYKEYKRCYTHVKRCKNRDYLFVGNTSVLQIPKQCDLSRRITALTENLEELCSERTRLLNVLDCTDDAGVAEAKKSASAMESMLAKLDQQEQRYAAELDDALKQHADMKEQAADLDPAALYEVRQALRPAKEREAVQQLQTAYDDKCSPLTMLDSQRDVGTMFKENKETRSIRTSTKSMRLKRDISSHKKADRGQER